MSPARIFSLLATAVCGVVLCGCFGSGQSQLEEEKEPHFMEGRSRVNAMDYHGAIDDFGAALEVNPRSGAAHRELGWLYEQKDGDPAAAIYHYQQYLKLRPAAADSETITQRVFGLKQVLAQAVLPMPTTPGVQKEIEQLMDENRKLRAEVEGYKTALAARDAAAQATPTRVTPTAPQSGGQQTVSPPSRVAPPPARPATMHTIATANASLTQSRKHKVQSGESPIGIARRYGVKLDALMQVNPGVNPKRLQVGQVLNLPAS